MFLYEIAIVVTYYISLFLFESTSLVANDNERAFAIKKSQWWCLMVWVYVCVLCITLFILNHQS